MEIKTCKFRAILRKEAYTNHIYKRKQDMTEPRYFFLEDLIRGVYIFSYPEHWHFSRWTGELDKNKVEIYEDDIMTFSDAEDIIMEMNGVTKAVVFERGSFRIKCHEYFAKVLDTETACEGKVVGNTFNNSELLNQYLPKEK